MSQQQVHPGERQVESSESQANDECAERSVCLQGKPRKLGVSR